MTHQNDSNRNYFDKSIFEPDSQERADSAPAELPVSPRKRLYELYSRRALRSKKKVSDSSFSGITYGVSHDYNNQPVYIDVPKRKEHFNGHTGCFNQSPKYQRYISPEKRRRRDRHCEGEKNTF